MGLFFVIMMLVFERINFSEPIKKYITRLSVLTYPAYLLHQDIGLIFLALFEQINPPLIGLSVIVFIFLLAEIVERATTVLVSRLKY